MFLCLSYEIEGQVNTKELFKLDSIVTNQENQLNNVYEECKASIVWHPDFKFKKSNIAIVYLHGFGASNREGNPIVNKLAKDFNANVYQSRLAGHGFKDVSGFKSLTPKKYIASAKKALEIGKKIGKKVILVSTSTGGTLSLYLASKDKDISSLILYSPFIDVIDKRMMAILTPEGKKQMIAKYGGETFEQERPKEQLPFWSTKYHINGYIALLQMLQNTMIKETFSQVNCPVFLGYYYKDEEHQDKVVSVNAMKEMFKVLGTKQEKKEQVAFPHVNNHVIGCDLRSNDWQEVYRRTKEFIQKQL